MLRAALNKFPRLKRAVGAVRDFAFGKSKVSTNYQTLHEAEAASEAERLRFSWQDQSLPSRQRELVDIQLAKYRKGSAVDVFDIFTDALRAMPDLQGDETLLEIGCSSGFYSEVLKITQPRMQYSGCDYSESFIDLARETYPNISFTVADATALPFEDSSFDIAVSGCCLLHIPNFAIAVQETARIARKYVIFHRTPVVWGQPDQWYRKQAYGIDTVEIHFNEQDFISLLGRNGLKIVKTFTLGQQGSQDQGGANRTYVCRKIL